MTPAPPPLPIQNRSRIPAPLPRPRSILNLSSERVRRVAAAPRVAFDYLAEPRNRPQWQSTLRAVDMLSDGPTQVGTRWLDRTIVGASPRLEITAMTPPSVTASDRAVGVWSEVGRWHGLTASLTLTFAPVAGDADATDLSLLLRIDGVGAWRPVARIVRLLAPRAVRADLRRALRIIERRSIPG